MLAASHTDVPAGGRGQRGRGERCRPPGQRRTSACRSQLTVTQAAPWPHLQSASTRSPWPRDGTAKATGQGLLLGRRSRSSVLCGTRNSDQAAGPPIGLHRRRQGRPAVRRGGRVPAPQSLVFSSHRQLVCDKTASGYHNSRMFYNLRLANPSKTASCCLQPPPAPAPAAAPPAAAAARRPAAQHPARWPLPAPAAPAAAAVRGTAHCLV